MVALEQQPAPCTPRRSAANQAPTGDFCTPPRKRSTPVQTPWAPKLSSFGSLLRRRRAEAELLARDDLPEDTVKERSLVVCGLGGPLCSVTVAHDWMVSRLKLEIESETAISVHEQNLLAHLTELDDRDLLYQVVPHDCQQIFLIRRPAEQAQRLRSVAEMSATCVSPGSVDVSNFTWEDRHAALGLVRLHPHWFSHLPAVLRADRRLTLEAVRSDPLMLEHASPAMQADKEVVVIAVEGRLEAFAYAHESLRSDVEFVEAVITGSTCVDRLLDNPREQLSWERSVLRLAAPNARQDPRFSHSAGLRSSGMANSAGFADAVRTAPAACGREPSPLAVHPQQKVARTRADRGRSRSQRSRTRTL